MAKETLAHVRKRLAATFPGLAFTYGTGGHGHNRGHLIEWTGGPDANAVRIAADAPRSGCGAWRKPTHYHFRRNMTEAELDVYMAEWDAGAPAREAAYVADKAARKAARKAKAADARAYYAKLRAKLADEYPGVTFRIERGNPHWTDGPNVASVAMFLGVAEWHCTRTLTVTHAKAEAVANLVATIAQRDADRLARRLAASRARVATTAKGMARKACIVDRVAAQFSLAF